MVERITVAVPTFRRPRSLGRLLAALAALETSADVAVLVADNDADSHEGFDLARQRAAGYRWPLTAIIAPERGIAQVRNLLVAEALKDSAVTFVAMIDDDEWPEPQWLEEFLSVQRACRADVLQGSILFRPAGSGVPDVRRPTGVVTMLQGAGNLLIRRTVLDEMAQPWFDPAFALTGGEDREFFERLTRSGTRFAWADAARAIGDVPQSRRDLSWILKRAYSTGNSDMRVLLKHRPGAATLLRESGKIAAALLLSLPLAVILGLSPNHRARPLQKLCRAAGKLTAMFGARYDEYRLVHGE